MLLYMHITFFCSSRLKNHDLTSLSNYHCILLFQCTQNYESVGFPAHPEVALGYCDVHCAAEKGKEGRCDDGAKTNLNQISLSYIIALGITGE